MNPDVSVISPVKCFGNKLFFQSSPRSRRWDFLQNTSYLLFSRISICCPKSNWETISYWSPASLRMGIRGIVMIVNMSGFIWFTRCIFYKINKLKTNRLLFLFFYSFVWFIRMSKLLQLIIRANNSKMNIKLTKEKISLFTRIGLFVSVVVIIVLHYFQG